MFVEHLLNKDDKIVAVLALFHLVFVRIVRERFLQQWKDVRLTQTADSSSSAIVVGSH